MSTEFVLDKLNVMRQRFKENAFTYFVNADQSNHFIVFDNDYLSEDERFIDSQFEITDSFYERFPDETFSFITRSRLSLLKSLHEVEDIDHIAFDWSDVLTESIGNTDSIISHALKDTISECDEPQFALAA